MYLKDKNILTVISIIFLVVPVLTYLLTKEDLTPGEVNVHAIDIVGGGVDTVSKDSKDYRDKLYYY